MLGDPLATTARCLGISATLLNAVVADNPPLPEHVLNALSLDDREQLRGVQGGDLVARVCAQLRPLPAEPAVSAPMLSAAPGVLLAGDLAQHVMGGDVHLTSAANMVGKNVLNGPHPRWLTTILKRPGCECLDPRYVNRPGRFTLAMAGLCS